jgi:hypothetical protein
MKDGWSPEDGEVIAGVSTSFTRFSLIFPHRHLSKSLATCDFSALFGEIGTFCRPVAKFWPVLRPLAASGDSQTRGKGKLGGHFNIRNPSDTSRASLR